MKIIEVTPENALQETFFCVKDVKGKAFLNKFEWFKKRYKEGLKIKIIKDKANKALGFIEYVPGKFAWRPVNAYDYMFIQCMYIYSTNDRGKGLASELIKICEEEAKALKLSGVCTMTSKGSWMANKKVFEKNNYSQADKRGRFELMVKKWNEQTKAPSLIDWESRQKEFMGWHLLYSNQCPWHEKSVEFIREVAKDENIAINIQKIKEVDQAQKSPSGFGVFVLLHNGKLIEDHYISKTRFNNILKNELITP